MSEASRAVVVASAGLAIALAWLSVRAARIPALSPDRLVAELRLAQVAAVVLVFVAGVYVGFAVLNEHRAGSGLDVTLAVAFFMVGVIAPTRDPRQALMILGLAFPAHAIVDILHRPGILPESVPRWYLIGCAVYDVAIGAICYLPILRRQ